MPEDSSERKLPKLKLKSASSDSVTPDQAPAQIPNDPKEEASKSESTISMRSAGGDNAVPAEPEPQAADSSPAFDPKNPFRKKVDPEPETPASTPPPAVDPPASAPLAETPQPQPTQQDPKPFYEPELPEPKGGSGVMVSLFMILALVLVLGGGGYAIWMVLNESPADTAQETAEPAAPESEPVQAEEKMNPIEKAKAAISKIPFIKTEEVANEDEAEVAPEEPAKPTAKPEKPSKTAPVAKPVETDAPAPATVVGDDVRSAVSSFLADVHIGGMRSGANARIMLNGDSYMIGDQVDAATGLKFIGIRDGKLLFRDKNGVVYAKSF